VARRVFFSFCYKRDIGRIGQIRNSWVTMDTKGFTDAANWESIKRQGEQSVKRWIDAQLDSTSVTVVLIGAETSISKWVKYEIAKSVEDGKGVLGIYIHNVKDFRTGLTDYRGHNPLDELSLQQNGRSVLLSEIYPTYEWINDDGQRNIVKWIEEAARKVGR